MEFTVAAGFTWISLILFVASLSASSPFGTPVRDVSTTTVCSTESGNNTYISYNVSKYNGTTLVLSCPGEAEQSAYWSRADGHSVLCATRNCTINTNRHLTNVDSGDYLCETSVENGTDYQFVHINVLAPPQLHNVVMCKGNENDECILEQNTDIFTYTRYHINVSYAGNGPFEVRWYHNETEFTCHTNFCEEIQNGPTYQILHLRANSLRDTMLMSGLYHAVVSNPYGTNESLIRLEFSCSPPDSLPYTPSKITVDLQEGSTLNESCGVRTQPSRMMSACITKNISATFADLAEDLDNCAKCIDANDRGEQCSRQFNSNITSIIANSLVEDGCPPVQLMNFMKSDVTVKDDDGLKIICAYADSHDHDRWQPYTSIHVRVYHHPNNHSHQVSVIVSSTVVCLVVALVVTLVVASCVVIRKKKRQRDNRSDVIQDETRGLLERTDNNPTVEPVEPFIPRQHDHYGTVSVLEVFPQELEGPAQIVTIHPASDGELGSEGRDAEFQHQSI